MHDTNDNRLGSEPMLTPGEVAAIFRVDVKTVTRWASEGRLRSVRTPGAHRRYYESDIRALLAAEPTDLDSVLAKAREVADKIVIDWEYPDADGAVTVLAHFEGACEFASGDSPTAALSAALDQLRAYRAGSAR